MDLDVLRGKTPEMVRKELWVGLLAYNLIRRVILQSTAGSDRTPRAVSFRRAADEKLPAALISRGDNNIVLGKCLGS
jgi:hypothetical protein